MNAKNFKDKISDEMVLELYKAITACDNLSDTQVFLEDLLTNQEVEKFAQRLKAAELLMQGETYEEVIHVTQISSTTLSRISKCLQYGDGGYKKIIDKIKKN